MDTATPSETVGAPSGLAGPGAAAAGAHTMQCMEIWGGNEAFDNAVAMPGLDAWVYSRPYKGDHSGGDVHYVSSCATGRITRVLIADVSGHGQGAAGVALTLRTLMRRYVNFVDQTRLVVSLNTEFTSLAQAGCFATAVVATYWAPTGYLVASNAGHPRPLWYRARTRQWEFLAAPVREDAARGVGAGRLGAGPMNLPLGIAEPTSYDQIGVYLEPGDLVLIYTDSLMESCDAAGRQLGEPGMLEMARALDAGTPRGVIGDLVARVTERAAGVQPDDDVTVLLLRHNGVAAGAFWRQGLVAPWRIAKSVFERLRYGRASPAALPELTLANVVGAVVPGFNRWWGSGRAKGQ